MKNKKRLFAVKLEGEGGTAAILEKMGTDLAKEVEIKLEAKGTALKTDLKTELEASFEEKKEAVKTELEATFGDMLTAHKQEVIELTKAASKSTALPTEVEAIQLQKLNACLKDGDQRVELEDLRKYNDALTLQARAAVRGEQVQLDATLSGFAGFDDAKGGALIVPELDVNIRQDFVEYDEGLFNAINFEPAMSRTKKVVVDSVEPDENTKAVQESLEAIGYDLDDCGFVSNTLNLKDYDTTARLTFDII